MSVGLIVVLIGAVIAAFIGGRIYECNLENAELDKAIKEYVVSVQELQTAYEEKIKLLKECIKNEKNNSDF